MRQFCFAPDFCRLVLWTLLRKESVPIIALVPEEEYTIKEMAETVAELSGVKKIVFDTTKADGQYRKTISNDLMK